MQRIVGILLVMIGVYSTAFGWELSGISAKMVGHGRTAETEVTVTLERAVQDFRDGKAVYEKHLAQIKALAIGQGIADDALRQSYYTVNANNKLYRLYGNIHFVVKQEKAAGFVAILSQKGYQTRSDRVEQCCRNY
jgi:hypothetical protein